MKLSRRFVVLFAGVALVAAACGGGAPASPSPSPTPTRAAATATPAPTPAGEIIIASDFPTSGADGASGKPAENGVAFAVSQTKTLKGFTLTHLPFDDAVNGVHDPQKGAQNAQQMAANAKVLGMAGPFNSNVARAMMPVLNRVPLVMISPANTNECLTQTFDYCDPKPAALRPTGKINYFRIAAPDTVQGPAMADFAIDSLKVKVAAVWSDNETFGKGVADNFQKRFIAKGGTVPVRRDFDTKTTNDFRPFLQAAATAGAQVIYAGATDGTKGCVPRAQEKGILDGTKIAYLGPDGIQSSECIKQAGDQAFNIFATVAAADATQNPEAKATVDAFKAAFPKKEDLGAYTFPAYDVTRILIDAIGRAIDAAGGKTPTREQVLAAVIATKDIKLTTGTYSFNQDGDPVAATMAFYEMKGTPADWVFKSQFAIK